MALAAADVNHFSGGSDLRLVGLRVSVTKVDAYRTGDHFPEFLAAVVVLPRQARFGGNKQDFGTKLGAGIIDAAALAGEKLIDEFFDLSGVDHKIAAPGPGEVLADEAKTDFFQVLDDRLDYLIFGHKML